eukprot:1192981-Prorocentrum_minimum.AAC.1
MSQSGEGRGHPDEAGANRVRGGGIWTKQEPIGRCHLCVIQRGTPRWSSPPARRPPSRPHLRSHLRPHLRPHCRPPPLAGKFAVQRGHAAASRARHALHCGPIEWARGDLGAERTCGHGDGQRCQSLRGGEHAHAVLHHTGGH